MAALSFNDFPYQSVQYIAPLKASAERKLHYRFLELITRNILSEVVKYGQTRRIERFRHPETYPMRKMFN